MNNMERDRKDLNAWLVAVEWLQRLLRLRRRAAEVWAITPDGKLIRM
jgi:hypothetical protein